jgi:hypothetical protein
VASEAGILAFACGRHDTDVDWLRSHMIKRKNVGSK